MRAGERPARLCTSRTPANRLHSRGDQGKRVTRYFLGVSGRRFKSCQPDLEKLPLTCSYWHQPVDAIGGLGTNLGPHPRSDPLTLLSAGLSRQLRSPALGPARPG